MVSMASFLFAKEVSNCKTTYSPSGAPGSDLVYLALLSLRETTSPSGLRTASSERCHCSRGTAPWKYSAAVFQLSASLPASIRESHCSAAFCAWSSGPPAANSKPDDMATIASRVMAWTIFLAFTCLAVVLGMTVSLGTTLLHQFAPIHLTLFVTLIVSAHRRKR